MNKAKYVYEAETDRDETDSACYVSTGVVVWMFPCVCTCTVCFVYHAYAISLFV